MGHNRQFEWDIFVSYRHVADEADEWVTKFCQRLEIKLDELLGERVKIWRDKMKLRAGDEWRPEIADALESTAIFLAIISRSYMRSNVCREEMDRFLGLYKRASETAPRLILPVYKQPPASDIPPDINDLHRPRTFYRDNPPGYDEFAPGQSTEKEFWDALSKLAQELTHQLDRIRGRERTRTSGTVYLAEVGRDLPNERDNLLADLRHRGYRVLPEKCYLWNASDITAKIDGDLDTADLTVHLITQKTPSWQNAVERTKEQLDRAVEAMSRRGKPAPLVWIQPGAEPEDPGLRTLIEYVTSELPERGVEFFSCGLEEFKSQVVSKLPRAATPEMSDAGMANDVAVLLDAKDVVAAKTLKLMLVEQFGCEPQPICVSESGVIAPGGTVNVPDGCGHCIIFWGTQSESWVRNLLARNALGRYLGKQRLCLYITAPDSDEKAAFVSGKAGTIRAVSADEDEVALRAFLGPNANPR